MLKTYTMLIKRALLLFWSLWYMLVLISNVTDAFKSLGVLPDTFSYSSGNFELIKEVTQLSPVVAGVLFAGVILWEGLATWFFWRATFRGQINLAFIISLGFWASMILADELFLVYKTTSLEGEHLGIFVAQLITLIAIYNLPDKNTTENK
jgi:hypothetical protein